MENKTMTKAQMSSYAKTGIDPTKDYFNPTAAIREAINYMIKKEVAKQVEKALKEFKAGTDEKPLDELNQRLSNIEAAQIQNDLQFEEIRDRFEDCEIKIINTATSEAVHILQLDKEAFMNWGRSRVAEIAAAKSKSTNIIYHELYNSFSETSAAAFTYNYEFCYNGKCKLNMIAELLSSQNAKDRALCFEFVSNILKMA